MSEEILIRAAREDDREFVVSLAERFAECDLPSWRTPGEVASGTRRWLDLAMSTPSDAKCILVAESDGARLGFVFFHETEDFFTGETVGHVSDIGVAAEAEGRGVASRLMREAERWSAGRGHARIGLNVFAGNDRARRLYEHLGYTPETTKYLKPIERS